MHMCSASITTPTPRGCRCGLEPVGDLLGQPLLDLRAAGEQLDHPGELGQAEDPLARQVADVRDAEEREHVVLADRVHRDAARQHQLVVALVVGERGEVEGARAEHLGVGRAIRRGVSAVDAGVEATPSAVRNAAAACSAAARRSVAVHDTCTTRRAAWRRVVMVLPPPV